jgi:hypothetical protein
MRGSHSMNAEALWNQIRAILASQVSAGCAETWFRPVRPSNLDRSVLDLEVPTEFFRASITENYLDLIREAAAKAAGSRIEIRLSCRSSEGSDVQGCVQTAHPLPVVRASNIESSTNNPSWLIESLWTHQAVGVIGGSPKSGKTWLALEMAVSVASGTPCLGRFAVPSPGRVLIYAAEDSAVALRRRIESLSCIHQIDFNQLDVHVITADSLRLDRSEHQDQLESTLLLYKPSLLILDPLVRVHAIDENVAGQVSTLLGYIRSLQRKTGAAIALVHHVRKNVSPNGGAGYSLRGSGDLYAWLDSFLYLRMHQGQRTLSAEHRSAPAFGPIALELAQSDLGASLKISSIAANPLESSPNDLASRITELLASAPEPLTVNKLRTQLQVRNERVVEAIRCLITQGTIKRLARGFSLSQ